MVLNIFQDFKIFINKMAKHKRHDSLVRDYETQKTKHLEKLASQMLKQDEKMQRLKDKSINKDFLKLF